MNILGMKVSGDWGGSQRATLLWNIFSMVRRQEQSRPSCGNLLWTLNVPLNKWKGRKGMMSGILPEALLTSACEQY
jgi:hypothetical protein